MSLFHVPNCPYGKVPYNLDNVNISKGNLPSKKDKIDLIKLSTIAGLCVISYFFIANRMGKILVSLGWVEMYLSNQSGRAAVDTLVSMFCILIPFTIGLGLIKMVFKEKQVLTFNAPRSGKLMFYAVLVGGLALVVSNFLTGMFVYFMDSIGVGLSSPDNQTFSGINQTLLLYLLRGALCPALIEEFAFRGVIMQPLRKYGDKFAIIVSSILFALMHGNLIQAPFAFLIGSVIGYVVVVTGSMWTGVLIHFLNNSYAIIMSSIAIKVSEVAYAMIFVCSSVILIIVGTIGVILFNKQKKKYYSIKYNGGTYKPYRYYFLNPVLIIAFYFIVKQMTEYVSVGG